MNRPPVSHEVEMKRGVIYSVLLGMLGVSGIAFAQSEAKPDARKPCPFSIVGMWRMEGQSELANMLFTFSPKGWVLVQTHSPDTLPQDLEMIGSVDYKLEKPAAPKRIVFTGKKGVDAFPPGQTSFDIVRYDDETFTTVNFATGEEALWVRTQTHRYFLTFAAIGGQAPTGGSAFAMWTTLDGRDMKIEAIGVQPVKNDAGQIAAVFGSISSEILDQIKVEPGEEDKKVTKDEKRKKNDIAMMRIELTQSEFERTHKIHDVWKRYIRDRKLPNTDPYLNAFEFIKRAAETLNQCSEKLALPNAGVEVKESAVKVDSRQQPMEYIRVVRKKNDKAHVTDAAFPWGWRPMLQLSGQ
jgi:hypothetical protein